MKIAADPNRWSVVGYGYVGEVGAEKMAGPAEEGERVLLHGAVLVREPLGIAAAIEFGNPIEDIGAGGHERQVNGISAC